MTPDSGRVVSVSSAVRWLAVRGVAVHENTVRHWIRRGHLTPQRREPGATRRGRRAEILIPLESLERIVACPCCSHRSSPID